MSKYIKLEDAINLFGRSGEYHADAIVDMLFFLPIIEVSEDDLYIPLNNQTVKRINRLHKDECGEYFDEEWLFNELEQISEFREVSEDCISREDLRRSLTRPLENNNADEMYWKGWHDCTVAVETRIADAPSVVPSRAEGEWIVKANGNNECSICGREKQDGWINFCGFCGAKMKG